MKIFQSIIILFVFALAIQKTTAQDWEMKQAALMTKFAADVDTAMPLPEYPRPQLVRADWKNLNGIWEYQPGEEADAVPTNTKLSSKILVPFPVESALSGVMEHHYRIWYRKMFTVPAEWSGKRIILHFDAVDWESEVYINGHSMGIHYGGYDNFSYDITDYLSGNAEQELIVRVYDPTKTRGIARGKQTTTPAGIMYTSTTGIWQPVWLEPVSTDYISNIKLIPDVDNNQLKITVNSNSINSLTVNVKGFDGNTEISTISGNANTELLLPVTNPKLWSPKSPFLYDLQIELKNGNTVTDSIGSYFGMRKIEVKKVDQVPMIFLNNETIFNMGPLDQGFWPDGIYRAPTDEALKYDIEITKILGFNFTRKHIKVESQRWYYWADKLGLMVWQDMPSMNSYDADPYPPIEKEQYKVELTEMINEHFNCPAIIMWVIFNEYQGQHDERSLSEYVRSMDPNRLINIGSGSTIDGLGDINDRHAYPPPAVTKSYTRANVCGEYGGTSLPIKDHLWNGEHTFYSRVEDSIELVDRYEEFGELLMEYKTYDQTSGAVYTEITDCEIEINGFMTYDRIIKVDTARVRKINERIIREKVTSKKDILETADKSKRVWKYSLTKKDNNWYMPDYDDSDWDLALPLFTDNNEHDLFGTSWTTSTIYLRKTFYLDGLSEDDYNNLTYKIFHDEDITIYINGEPVDNFSGYNTYYQYLPMSDKAKDALIQNGKNTVAIICKQTAGGQAIDFGITRLATFTDDTTCTINIAPANRSFDADTASVTLKWKPGQFAKEHKVYLDTTPDFTTASLVSTQNEAAFTATGLLKDVSYFWRVDAITNNDTLTGAVWKFTTGPNPDTLDVTDTNDIIVPNPTGISKFTVNTAKIYPNPVSENDVLYIKSNAENYTTVEIWSLSGSKVFAGTYNSRIISINLEQNNLKPGSYLIRMKSDEGYSMPQKLIILE